MRGEKQAELYDLVAQRPREGSSPGRSAQELYVEKILKIW